MDNKIFFGIPNQGIINIELAKFLMNHSFRFESGCFSTKQPTDANRNFIVDRFLESECDWLFFCDSDMIPPDDIFNMLEDCKYDNFNILSPINLIRQENKIRSNIFGEQERINENYLAVDSCGCGCCFINRKVFESMKQPYFQFVLGEKGELKISENINFTNKAKKLGFDCFIDTRYKTNHLKTLGLMELEKMKVG